MRSLDSGRLGNVSALARIVKALPSDAPDSLQHKRRMIAEFCKLLGAHFSKPKPDPTAGLSPRHLQTLRRMLKGDGEKQVAQHLGVSRHTVHVYVKALYQHFGVNTRGELFALFVKAPESVEKAVPTKPRIKATNQPS
jgi:DNA-binding CsgD family transcriptional regulator